jgi:hypothetical protein
VCTRVRNGGGSRCFFGCSLDSPNWFPPYYASPQLAYICLYIDAQLNADIALFRNLHGGNYDDGRADCAFEEQSAAEEQVPVCPNVEEAVLIGAELKHDNVQFKVT